MKSPSPRALFSALLFFGAALAARGQALDPVLSGTRLWQTPREGFVEQYHALGFYWLSSAHDRAESHSKGLTLFGAPVYEVDAAFNGDKLSGLTVSIYNRGDAGDLDFDQWKTLVTNSVNNLTTFTKATPAGQGQEATSAVKAYAMAWQTPVTKYLLEYSFTKEVKSRNIPFRAEFLRLQVTPPEKPQTFMAAALASAAATPQAAFDGPSHIKKDPAGDVRLDTVPMVDQGRKGYCVVATAERVMRYYGIPVDEHELAELANSSASQGTSDAAMFDSLKKLAQRLRVRTRTIEEMDAHQIIDVINTYNQLARRNHVQEIPDMGSGLSYVGVYSAMKPDLLKAARTRNKGEITHFQQLVQDSIDQGIPLLWTVILGIVHEDNAPQVVGGHMRLIIGYNATTDEILYSDSWGPGHELKRMSAPDAWTMTIGLNTIEPIQMADAQ